MVVHHCEKCHSRKVKKLIQDIGGEENTFLICEDCKSVTVIIPLESIGRRGKKR
jgi:hypothetical protein